MKKTTDTLLQHLDLSPSRAVPVLPEGLGGVAKPGDHIARKSYSEGFWHHGIFVGQNPDSLILGDYCVLDSSPRKDGSSSVQISSLKDFLGKQPVQAAAIIRYDGDEDLGRGNALTNACLIREQGTENWHLVANNCEAFATLCWTGRYDPFVVIRQRLSDIRLLANPPEERPSKCLSFYK